MDVLTNPRTHGRLLIAVALFVYLALLVIWGIVAIGAAPLGPLDALTFGLILGGTTGVGLIVRRRWRSGRRLGGRLGETLSGRLSDPGPKSV